MGKIERGVLHHSKRSHMNKLDEHMDENIDSIPLESTIQNINVLAVSKKELEQLDQDITFVLNKVRKR